MFGQVAKTDLINACPMLIHSINSPLTSSHLIQTQTTKSNMYILDLLDYITRKCITKQELFLINYCVIRAYHHIICLIIDISVMPT